jgi:hypothetical protein
MHSAAILVLKLAATPVLIAAASLAGRRWGPAVGGWLVGLPLTSGPVAVFLALEHGPAFAAAAALGSLAGAIAQAAFCLAYAALAHRGWPAALVAGCAAFPLAAIALQRLAPPAAALVVGVFAALALALALMPTAAGDRPAPPPPRWDIPARMLVTTALVVAITGAASTLGPRLSGLLATFPVYAAILAIFAHRAGGAPATHVLRGLLLGLFAFAVFFVVLGAVIERAGIAAAFALATAAALTVQAASLALVLRRAHSGRLRRMRSGD